MDIKQYRTRTASNEYKEVISALTELRGWLKDYEGYRSQIEKIIARLKNPSLSDLQREKIKKELSYSMIFHPKALGDIYIKDFPNDKPDYSWWNYLSKICDICQKGLSEDSDKKEEK